MSVLRLSLDAMRRRDRRIVRDSLCDPASSPWQVLYNAANDQAFIMEFGDGTNNVVTEYQPDRAAFRSFLQLVALGFLRFL